MFDINSLDILPALYGDAPIQQPFVQPDFMTADILKLIMPTLKDAMAIPLAAAINVSAPTYHLNRPGVFHEFIATCAEESGEFTVFEEKLFYKVSRLMAVWPSRFPTVSSAIAYANNPKGLANKVYANRLGNGDEKSGDGWLFRGGGPIQFTGRALYTAYAKYKGTELLATVDAIKKDIAVGIDSAMWFFVVYKGLLDEAEKNDFLAITKAVNGGTTNMALRQHYLDRAMQYMPA